MSAFYNSLDFHWNFLLGEMLTENHNVLKMYLTLGLPNVKPSLKS